MLEQTVHGLMNELNRLEQRCWNHHDKSRAMFMHDRTRCQGMMNNNIELRCYNNHELGCCIKLGFACSNICVQPLSIRQALYNMLKHDSTILLFYQSCSWYRAFYRASDSTWEEVVNTLPKVLDFLRIL